METKYAVIGTWTNPDKTKQWDLLEGPMSLNDANEALKTIDTKENCIDHDEFVVSWTIYELMLKNLN